MPPPAPSADAKRSSRVPQSPDSEVAKRLPPPEEALKPRRSEADKAQAAKPRAEEPVKSRQPVPAAQPVAAAPAPPAAEAPAPAQAKPASRPHSPKPASEPRRAPAAAPDAAAGNGADVWHALRVSVKRSARDPSLFILRRLEDGKTPPPGTREALIVVVESSADILGAPEKGN